MTFNTDLGDVGTLTADIMSMTGTAPVIAVSENVPGVAPSFASLDPYNSLPLGSATLTDLSDLSMTVSGLEEGVPYYFRVTASNYIGAGAYNRFRSVSVFRCVDSRVMPILEELGCFHVVSKSRQRRVKLRQAL